MSSTRAVRLRDDVPRLGLGARRRRPPRCLRVLLTHDQVREYELPAAAGKAGDPRWAGFASRHGLDPGRPGQWEVEALHPAELQRLVLASTAPYIDQAVLRDRIAQEERQRRQLRAFAEGWSHRRPPGPE